MKTETFMAETRKIYALHGLPARIADKDARKLLAKDNRRRARKLRAATLSKPVTLSRALNAGTAVRQLNDQQAAGIPATGNGLRKSLLAAGADPSRIALMMQPDADPQLREMFMAQHLPGYQAEQAVEQPTVQMDQDRLALHRNGQAIAAARCRNNPNLDPCEQYILATQEIEDARTLVG